MLLNLLMNLQKKIQVHPAFAQSFAHFFALARAQIEGLIAVYIEVLTGKVWKQLIIKLGYQLY